MRICTGSSILTSIRDGRPDNQTAGDFVRADGEGRNTSDLADAILPVADFSGGFHDAVVDAWMDYFKQNGIPAVESASYSMIGPDARVIGYPISS